MSEKPVEEQPAPTPTGVIGAVVKLFTSTIQSEKNKKNHSEVIGHLAHIERLIVNLDRKVYSLMQEMIEVSQKLDDVLKELQDLKNLFVEERKNFAVNELVSIIQSSKEAIKHYEVNRNEDIIERLLIELANAHNMLMRYNSHGIFLPYSILYLDISFRLLGLIEGRRDYKKRVVIKLNTVKDFYSNLVNNNNSGLNSLIFELNKALMDNQTEFRRWLPGTNLPSGISHRKCTYYTKVGGEFKRAQLWVSQSGNEFTVLNSHFSFVYDGKADKYFRNFVDVTWECNSQTSVKRGPLMNPIKMNPEKLCYTDGIHTEWQKDPNVQKQMKSKRDANQLLMGWKIEGKEIIGQIPYYEEIKTNIEAFLNAASL